MLGGYGEHESSTSAQGDSTRTREQESSHMREQQIGRVHHTLRGRLCVPTIRLGELFKSYYCDSQSCSAIAGIIYYIAQMRVLCMVYSCSAGGDSIVVQQG